MTGLQTEKMQSLHIALQKKFADFIVKTDCEYDEITVQTTHDKIIGFLIALRDDADFAFKQLVDLCGVDYPSRINRFDVVYHLLSLHHNMRLRIRLEIGEEQQVPSAVSVFPVANWYEREAFDMYGIIFSGHPDLRRILTDYGFSGHPLRKDFPVTGFVECRYDEALKRVVYEPVKLVQEFRNFDFMSPWEGAEYVLDNHSVKDKVKAC